MPKDRETKRFVVEPHSPYYLYLSDGLGVLITAEIFNGKNYDLWEKGCTNSLEVEEQIGLHRWDPKQTRSQRGRLY